MDEIQRSIYERFKEITHGCVLCGSPSKAESVTACLSLANKIPRLLLRENMKDAKKVIPDRYKAGRLVVCNFYA